MIVDRPLVSVSPAAAAWVLRAYGRAVAPWLRTQGLAVPDEVRELLDDFRKVAEGSGRQTVGSAWSEVAAVRTLSVMQTADRLRCSRRAVVERLNRGTLPGRKVGRSWAVDAAAVEALEVR